MLVIGVRSSVCWSATCCWSTRIIGRRHLNWRNWRSSTGRQRRSSIPTRSSNWSRRRRCWSCRSWIRNASRHGRWYASYPELSSRKYFHINVWSRFMLDWVSMLRRWERVSIIPCYRQPLKSVKPRGSLSSIREPNVSSLQVDITIKKIGN